jgi:hypothetical protein
MEDTFISWAETVDPRGINTGRLRYLNKSRDPEMTPFQWDDTLHAGMKMIVNCHHISFLNRLVDFHEIWLGDSAIQGDVDAIIFVPIASTILTWLMFKFQTKLKYTVLSYSKFL